MPIIFTIITGCYEMAHPIRPLGGLTPELKKAQNTIVFIEYQISIGSSLFGKKQFNGVIISPDGWVVTVAHGISKNVNPVVHFNNKKFKAKTIFLDPVFDWALLKINSTENNFPYANIFPRVQYMLPIFLLGRQSDCEPVVYTGKILAAKFNISSNEIDCLSGGKLRSRYMIQNAIIHTGYFYEGLSGSGLFNNQGDLIGINTALFQMGSKQYTLAEEFICFLPIVSLFIGKKVNENILFDHCTTENITNAKAHLEWVLDGLVRYEQFLGRDINKLYVIRNNNFERAIADLSNGKSLKETVRKVWKQFLADSRNEYD